MKYERMKKLLNSIAFVSIVFIFHTSYFIFSPLIAQVHIHTKITRYVPPRPAFAGFHVGLSKDSAFRIMSRIATRSDTLHVDSLILLESDSVQILGLAAYVQLQIVHGAVRTVVINWHPLAGENYTNLRDNLAAVLERAFGHGIVFTNESLTYHRWETEDGTSEVSHSDKYMRVFLRLGKPRE
jgi:hypothetical protein